MSPLPRSPSSSTPFLRAAERLAPAVLTALLLAGVPAALPAQGTAPWDGPAFEADPAAVLAAVAELPAPADAGVEILLADTEYVVEDTGLASYRQRLVYRVLTGDGLHGWSTVDFPWSPWYQDRPEIRARVITPGGRVHGLEEGTIGEAPLGSTDPDTFVDERQLQAPLPAMEVGAVVETEVRVARRNPYFAAGEVRRQWLAFTVPVRHTRVTVESPEELDLQLRTGGIEAQPRVATRDGRVVRTFEARDLPAITRIDPGLPPEEPLAAFVSFATGPSWGDVARAYSAIVDQRVAESAGLALPLGRDDDFESQWARMEALVQDLHARIRYTGVQFGDGGLVPRPPHLTLERRFGDCKDKSVLLTTLLRRAGIPAYLALLTAGPGVDIDPDLPGLGLFNHAIVYVPGRSPLWIDATDPYSRLGQLPSQAQGRWALVASPNTRTLIRTPTAASRDNLTREVRTIRVAGMGRGSIQEDSYLTGAPARELRASWAGAEEAEVRELLADYVEASYGAETLGDVERTPSDDLSQPFELSLTAEGAAWATTDMDEAVVLVQLSGLFEGVPSALFPGSEERTRDFVFPEPYRTEWSYRIHIPDNLELRELPDSQVDELGPATLERTWRLSEDGRLLEGELAFDTGPRRWTARQVEAFKAQVEELNASNSASLIVWFDQKVQKRIAAGDMIAALEEARRQVAARREQAFPRAQMARALLTAGLGSEARQMAESAARVEPTSYLGHYMEGWTKVHDPVGRHLHPGFDPEGAEAAYRRSLEQDPEDDAVRLDLAILLEHDGQARRYAPDADLEAAATLYLEALEEAREAGEEPATGLVANYLLTLLWSDHFEDLMEALDTWGETPERLYLKLVALAATEGADRALAEARRQVADREQRVSALVNAGQQLMLRRYYPEAAALVRAAGREADNAAEVMGLAEFLAGIERHENLEFSRATPEGLVRTLFVELFRDGASPESLLPLMAPSLRAAVADEDLQTDLGDLRQSMENEDLPVDALLDFIHMALDVVEDEEHSTATERKVQLRIALLGEEYTEDLLLTREEDGWSFVALGSPGTTGLEVLHLLDQGDTETARGWLERVAEMIPHRPDPDDPLGSALFHRLWSSEAPDEVMDLAAVALLLLEEELPSELPVEEILERHRRATEDPARLRDLDQALVAYLLDQERYREAQAVMERLFGELPDSDVAFATMLEIDYELQDATAFARHLTTRLERDPDDPLARILRHQLAELQGNLERSVELLEQDMNRPDTTYLTYNSAAWTSVAAGRVDPQVLEWAQEGAERSNFRSAAVLHTLATVYAALDRPMEAHRVLLQSLEVRAEPPGPAEWLILGRIAESYDLPAAARGYYERALEPVEGENLEATSVRGIARRWLAALPEDGPATVEVSPVG